MYRLHHYHADVRAIRFQQQGPPSVLTLDEVPPLPPPGPGEVRLAIRAASVNHLDIWTRRELRGVTLPRIPGAELGFHAQDHRMTFVCTR